MSLEERRKFGKFQTPPSVAKFIVTWTIRKCDDIVLDPCTGSGILLFEAIQRLRNLGASSGSLNNIHGVDIDGLSIKNLKRVLGTSQNVIHADFLKVNVFKDGSVLNDNTALPFVDVVICNPPYTRHQQLDPSYKEEIAKIIERESSMKASRQSSIYTFFLIHAAQFLKEGGRMAFVTPSSFLDSNYGAFLKKFLVGNFKIVAIIVFSEERLMFPRVLTTTCITLLEKNTSQESIDHTVKFLKVSLPLNSDRLLRITERPDLLEKRKWGKAASVPQNSLNPGEKWRRYFGANKRRVEGLIPLGRVAKVKRGIATGANEFFALSDDIVQKLRLEPSFLKPALIRARDASFYDFTHEDFEKLREDGKRVWLLSSDKSKDEIEGTNLLKYIERGERLGFHLRHLTSSRKIWYSSERREPSSIIFPCMSREKPRFIYNEANILVLNNFHYVYPRKEEINCIVELKALLSYLNSNRTLNLLRDAGRIYGGGLLKVEPKDLEKLPVIDLQRLNSHDIQTLASFFDQLCVSARTGDYKVLGKIDRLIDLLVETLEVPEK